MKRKIRLSIILFIMLLVFLNVKSLATFEIEKYLINCEVTEEGNIKIKEDITYSTNEYRNGVIRNILTENSLNKKNSADSLVLESVKVDGEEYKRVATSSNGRSGVYTYNIEDNEYSIKVFSPFQHIGKTVTYEYTLKNVAVKYKDTAEIFWNFIGSEWDTNINNVQINIQLPMYARNKEIYVFGHGADNGTFKKNMNFITLEASGLKPYQALDARILFNEDSIPKSNKIVNKNVLQSYIKDEEEGFRKERPKMKVFGIATVEELTITFIGIILTLWIVVYVIFDKEHKVKSEKYYREIPYDLESELLQYIYYGKEQKNTLWISFLSLLKKGVYSIEKMTNKVGVETYKIIYNKEPSNIKGYQKQLISLLNSYMTTNEYGEKSVDLLTLKSKMKNSTSSCYREFIKELKMEKESIFGETVKQPKAARMISIILMAVLIFVMGLVSIITGTAGLANAPMIIFFLIFTTAIYSVFFKAIDSKNLVLLGFFLFHFSAFQGANISLLVSGGIGMMYIPYLLAFIFMQYTFRIKKDPKELREARGKIKGLRNYIKDYSLLKDSQLDHIHIWEDYFIMAIALNVNKKATNYLYDLCSSETNNINFSTSLSSCGNYSMFSHSMGQPFNTYVSTYVYASSRSSGSRSSFSGSRGGFSGGSRSGGGGRRRWRRKLLLKRKVKCMYNTIIIGMGPAGVTAGIYLKRSNLSVLMIGTEESALVKTEKIENYYGFENGISGKELYEKGIKQAQNLGVDVSKEEVIKIEKGEICRVYTDKNVYESKNIILATGNKKNKPNIEGIEEFEGRGISYCAICDGFFYRQKNVAIIGSGNYAFSELKDLINIAKNITILTNGKDIRENRNEETKVDICTKNIKKIDGENRVSKIIFEDDTSMDIDGIFIAEGIAGSTEFAKKIGILTDKNKIIVDNNMRTNIEHIYACGDCVGGVLQISKALYEGMIAAFDIIKNSR